MPVGDPTPDPLRRASDELERAAQQLVEAVHLSPVGDDYTVTSVLGRVDAALGAYRSTKREPDAAGMSFEALADGPPIDDIVTDHLRRTTKARLQAHLLHGERTAASTSDDLERRIHGQNMAHAARLNERAVIDRELCNAGFRDAAVHLHAWRQDQ